MNLKTYMASLAPTERDVFAESVVSTRGHLQNIAYGYRTCAPELAVLIEKATNGAVTRQELRPDDWQAIWPELSELTSIQAA